MGSRNELAHIGPLQIPVGGEGESWPMEGRPIRDDVKPAVVNMRASISIQSSKEEALVVQWGRIFIAEFVGTALLMCLGCMSNSIVNPVAPLQSAVTFGLIVASLIQVFGHISAAHFNPAVTAAFYVKGDISALLAIVYVVAEMTGATAGYVLLKVVSPADTLNGTCFCCTIPDRRIGEIQAIAVEFLATSLLILVLCACTDPVNSAKQDSVPLKFGMLIIALSISAGPYTGASMNPARSLAPALINWNWERHWVYWVGPFLAGFIVPLFYQLIFMKRENAER